MTGQPWSSKKLRECYEDGARAFGWRGRPSEPERDGDWLVGQGMADCAMGCFRNPSDANVRLHADGTAVIEAGFQDIGTGTLTIFPQLVAGVLGLEPGMVSCAMGDTTLPQAGPTFGSSTTMGVGAAVMAAAHDALEKLRERSGEELGEAPGVGALSAAMSAAGIEQLVGSGHFQPDDDIPYALRTFGAVFVEVGVDPELGLVRLRRVVGRYSVGRVVNPHGRSGTDTGKWIKGVRYSLLKDPSNQSATQLLRLAEVQQTNKRMFRAFLLNGELRFVYKVPKHEAPERLGRVARVGVPLKAETVREARAHDPQTQSWRTRSGRDRDQQRTPRSPKQQGQIDLTPRIRIPLRQRAHRNDLPLLRWHPIRAPATDESPPNREESRKSCASGRARSSARRPEWARCRRR